MVKLHREAPPLSIRTALLAIALGASASPAFAQGEGEAVASESGPYAIISPMNGMCLNVSGGVLQVGKVLITWPCVGTAHNERFHTRPMPDGRVQIFADSPRGDLCVEAPGYKGQQLRLAYCRPDVDGQHWQFSRGRSLKSRGGYCANIEGENRAQGTRVISWPCVGAINELWNLVPAR